MTTLKYEIIINKWDMDTIELITILHAQDIHTDNIDTMITVLRNKFPESEDYELCVIENSSTTKSINI